MTIKAILPAIAGTALVFGAAQAAPVTGGTTVIEVNNDLDLGIAVFDAEGDPVGDQLSFGITGGDVDLAAFSGQIEHTGASFDIGVGSNFVTITDLVIDLNLSVITGTVFDSSSVTQVTTGAALFDFDVSQLDEIDDLFDLGDASLDLLVSADFAAIITTVLLVDIDLTGVVFGSGATNPGLGADAVPLPGAALLFGTVAAGAAIRRKMAA